MENQPGSAQTTTPKTIDDLIASSAIKHIKELEEPIFVDAAADATDKPDEPIFVDVDAQPAGSRSFQSRDDTWGNFILKGYPRGVIVGVSVFAICGALGLAVKYFLT